MSFWIFFAVNVDGIGAYFVYFHWYLKKDVTRVELLLALQQHFTKHINGKSQTNNIKNRTNHFYNDRLCDCLKNC